MSPFEYLVGIHTIVLGLATAYLLTTIADTIKYRRSISHYWVHTAWSVLLQFLLIGWWYGLWRLMSNETQIAYGRFLVEFAFTVSLFMAVRLLTIDLGEMKRIDLKEHFYQIRVPFFVFLAIPYVVAISSGWLSRLDTGTPVGDIVTMAVQLLVPLIGAMFANERLQTVLVIVYGVTYLAIEFQQLGVGFASGATG